MLRNILNCDIKKTVFLSFKILAIIFLVWIAQTLFLNQAARSGFDGWDDWGMVITYDAFNGNDLRSFPAIARFYGSPYLWSESYNIGIIKNIFGLHQATLRLLELLAKSIAALSVGYMVFKLTKDKLFSLLVIFFFAIFASTAGPLDHIIFIGAYGTIIFMCFYVLSYIQAMKKPKWILLSLFSFLLAILVSPSRAYLIVPVPFLVELAFLIRSFKILTFIRKTLIFYFPLLIFQALLYLNGDRLHPAFMPQLDMLSRFQQITSGTLYTLSLPFQEISNLFIDISFIREILQNKGESLLYGFTVINLILFILSICLGLVLKGKKYISFTFKLMSLTIMLEIIFYLFGLFSLRNGQVSYISAIKWLAPYSQELSPSIFQASLGGFYFILGVLIGWEWWKNQRKNIFLKVIFFAWLWSIFSEFLLYLTSHSYGMASGSADRYIITCSLGAVIFIAGVFVICIQYIAKMEKLHLKLFLFSLVGIFLLLIAWKNYDFLDQYYYKVNENHGSSAYWQDAMYLRFLSKFGEENLAKSIILYISFKEKPGSFVNPARFRLFYNKNGKLIRDNCKSVTSDIDVLKNSYVVQKDEEGFLIDSICINSSSLSYQKEFYPFSNFYAYRIEDGEFFNIRDDIIKKVSQSTKPAIFSPIENRTVNNLVVKPKGIFPDSTYYPFKRVWEKFYLFVLSFQPKSKVNYEITLLNERLEELNYVAENKLLSKVEDSSKRFAYQAGVLISELIKQNKAQDENNLMIMKFEDDIKLLARLRDLFSANSSYWLFIQQDIDTLNILSSRLR